MDRYTQNNRRLWDEWALIHARAKNEFYDLEGFKSGELSLRSIERDELGPVAGKSLLHLQCHFGLDTLSWARLGAQVTGVDFSGQAIDLARALSEELAIPATFLCADVYDLPNVLAGKFDVVFASYGVLCWLPDLRRWAEVVAHFLKAGGIFYIVEFHPFLNVFDDEERAGDLRVVHSYFHKPQPEKYEPGGSYADRSAQVSHPSYEWTHGLGDILNALLAAGLKIQFLHEFPYSVYRQLPCMRQDEEGGWRLKGDQIPLMFSLQAVKR